eukprot:1161599-Pelagomonas_calceolata.AAC.9
MGSPNSACMPTSKWTAHGILAVHAGQQVFVYWYGTPRPRKRGLHVEQKYGVWYEAAIRGFNPETGLYAACLCASDMASVSVLAGSASFSPPAAKRVIGHNSLKTEPIGLH